MIMLHGIPADCSKLGINSKGTTQKPKKPALMSASSIFLRFPHAPDHGIVHDATEAVG